MTAFSRPVAEEPRAVLVAAESELTRSTRPSRVDQSWPPGANGTFALTASCAERFREAELAFELLLEMTDRLGAPEAFTEVTLGYPYLLCRLGRLTDALVVTDRLDAVEQGPPSNQCIVAVIRAYVLHQLGRLEESDAWCARAGPAAGQAWVDLFRFSMKADRLARDGDVAGACELYRTAEKATARLGITEPCAAPWVGHAVAAFLSGGRLDDAARVLEWAEHGTEKLSCRWPLILVARGRASMAERCGDRQAAAEQLSEAMLLHDQVDLPLERIETLLQYGAFRCRRGETAQARELLGEALRSADDHSAGWLAHQARAELRAAGGRTRRRAGDGTLTPAEHRVAQVAAAGGSNKEIATQLLVSVATVETHLQHIFRKLQIKSRRQLMAMVDTGHGAFAAPRATRAPVPGARKNHGFP